jgi:uncharacterized protein YjiS (DUF1127 family)
MSVYSLSASGLADAEVGAPSSHASSAFARFVGAARATLVHYRQRKELAALDTGTLRDLGVEPDEIGRIHSGSDLTPRAWK